MAGYASPSWTNGAAPAVSAANLLNLSQAVELAEHPYGVCSTAAATVAKAVTVDFSGTLSLFAGLTVRVKFSNGNSATNPTLNVNSTGAKAIMSYGTTRVKSWLAGQTLELTYDGTNWLITGIDSWTKAQTLSDATAAQINTLTGTLPTTPDAALSLLATYASGNVKCAYGNYTGTGTFGSANPNTLNLGFNAVILFVYDAAQGLNVGSGGIYWNNSIVWLQGMPRAFVSIPYEGQASVGISQSGGVISWYSTTSQSQLNANGATYYYIAIGV